MPKTKAQKAYEADLALIAEAEEEIRAAQERKQRLEAAKARIEAYELQQAEENAAKERANAFIEAVKAVEWTSADNEAINGFRLAAEKQAKLENLIKHAASPAYWENVPDEYAQTLRDEIASADDSGVINPCAVFSTAVKTLEAR